MDFLLTDMTQPAFWIAALKIIGINIILSGDNAVVIALACRMLPPRERFWGMILGAGVAVLLRILFTLVVAEAMGYQWLKLIGGVLLLWVAVKLIVPENEGDEKIEAASNLWKAVRIVAVADIVMSLDNVIAIAAAAETAAMALDPAHAQSIKAVLIGFGLVTSRADDHRGQRAPDGVARPLPDFGLGGCGTAGLGRGRHHDQGRRACPLVQSGAARSVASAGGGRRRDLRVADRLGDPARASQARAGRAADYRRRSYRRSACEEKAKN